jgi:hypothetical protein
VAEFVRERAIPGGQTLLDQKNVAIRVLSPLTAHPGRQVGGADFDRSVAILTHRLDQPRKRDFAPPRREIEDSTDRACHAAASRH